MRLFVLLFLVCFFGVIRAQTTGTGTGACCFNETVPGCFVCQFTQCEAFNGTFQGVGTTCTNTTCLCDAVTPGACCHGNITNLECTPCSCLFCKNLLGGTFLGPDALPCDIFTCPVLGTTTGAVATTGVATTGIPTGACCLANNGSCVALQSDLDCTFLGGVDSVFFGLGTVCNATTCNGACCISTGACIDVPSEALCVQGTGIFQGFATLCPNSGCVGGCCRANGTCVNGTTTTNGCNEAGGDVFLGLDTVCNGTACLGACCQPDGSCVPGISSIVCGIGMAPNIEPGTFLGAGSTCVAGQCEGGCCKSNGVCVNGTTDLPSGGCDALLDDVFLGLGTVCSRQACNGACCRPSDGDCFDINVVSCTSITGTFLGATTTCANDGGQCVGACCKPPAGPGPVQCTDNTTATNLCLGVADTFLGLGTTCANNGSACNVTTTGTTGVPLTTGTTGVPPPVTGACCDPLNLVLPCQQLTSAACLLLPGAYQGDGVLCAPGGQCPVIPLGASDGDDNNGIAAWVVTLLILIGIVCCFCCCVGLFVWMGMGYRTPGGFSYGRATTAAETPLLPSGARGSAYQRAHHHA